MKKDVVTASKGEAHVAHIMERKDGTWRHVESCEGDDEFKCSK
jgi:hypothetical protein